MTTHRDDAAATPSASGRAIGPWGTVARVALGAVFAVQSWAAGRRAERAGTAATRDAH